MNIQTIIESVQGNEYDRSLAAMYLTILALGEAGKEAEAKVRQVIPKEDLERVLRVNAPQVVEALIIGRHGGDEAFESLFTDLANGFLDHFNLEYLAETPNLGGMQ